MATMQLTTRTPLGATGADAGFRPPAFHGLEESGLPNRNPAHGTPPTA